MTERNIPRSRWSIPTIVDVMVDRSFRFVAELTRAFPRNFLKIPLTTTMSKVSREIVVGTISRQLACDILLAELGFDDV